MAPRNILGLDLGQAQQFSALAAVRKSGQDVRGSSIWAVPVLTRWPLGTPYPDIVSRVAAIAERLEQPTLVLDGTAVGRGTMDLFRRTALPVRECIAVTVTAGHQAHHSALDTWTAPKKDLVAAVQSVLQGRRLKIARGLREAVTLMRELSLFRVKPTAASDGLDGWREGSHDDLVLAVALALWLGEFGPPPEMNIWHIRLDQSLPAVRPAPQVVYPEVRYFAPYDSFQPLPHFDGQPLLSCPDFKTQTQAAYFNATLYSELGLSSDPFIDELSEEERSAVEKKVTAFMRHRRLAAPARTESSLRTES